MFTQHKNKLLSISIALVTVVWAIGLTFASSYYNKPCIGSIIAAVVAFLIGEAYLLFLHRTPRKEAVEVGAIPTICTILLLVISLVLNTLFVYADRGNFNPLLLILNLLILAIYVIVVLFAEKSSARLDSQLIRMETKQAEPSNISHKLGNLLSIAENDEIRSQLKKLKEMVDYSSNISSARTAMVEQQMSQHLDTIMELIVSGTETAIVCKKIKEAEITWKTRNSAR